MGSGRLLRGLLRHHFASAHAIVNCFQRPQTLFSLPVRAPKRTQCLHQADGGAFLAVFDSIEICVLEQFLIADFFSLSVSLCPPPSEVSVSPPPPPLDPLSTIELLSYVPPRKYALSV